MLHGALLAFEAGLTRQSPQLSPDPSHWANTTQPDAPAHFLGAESDGWQLTLFCSLGAEQTFFDPWVESWFSWSVPLTGHHKEFQVPPSLTAGTS